MNIIAFIKKWLKKHRREQTIELGIETFDVSESNTSILVDSELPESEITLVNIPIKNGHYPIFLTNPDTKTIDFEETVRNDKGRLEDFFLDYLLDIPGFEFRNNIKIKIGEKVFIPDFCLLNEKLVIEIDEPYALINGELKPIHYIGCDDARDEALIESGWKIVRFAEEQIAKYPNNCCDYIVSVLSQQPLNIEKVACWTCSDAENMIKNNFRNDYLPMEYKGIYGVSKYTCRSLPIKSIKRRLNKQGQESIVIHIKLHESTIECCISKQDFLTVFFKTDFFLKSNLDADYIQTRQEPLFVIASWLNDSEQDFISGMRIVGDGVIEEKYFNLKSNSDFKFDIPEDNTLRWAKCWKTKFIAKKSKGSIIYLFSK
jgi:very-short-patch-repair endonuclease